MLRPVIRYNLLSDTEYDRIDLFLIRDLDPFESVSRLSVSSVLRSQSSLISPDYDIIIVTWAYKRGDGSRPSIPYVRRMEYRYKPIELAYEALTSRGYDLSS